MFWTSPRAHRGRLADGICFARWLVWLLLLTCPVSVSGPRPSAPPRDRADLERGRVTAQTANLRAQLLTKFAEWLSQEEPALTDLPHAARHSPVLLAERLEEYGRVMYEHRGLLGGILPRP
jgi:hypothetical protein